MVTTMPLGSTTLCDATSCDGDHLAIRMKTTCMSYADLGGLAVATTIPLGSTTLCDATSGDGNHLTVRMKTW